MSSIFFLINHMGKNIMILMAIYNIYFSASLIFVGSVSRAGKNTHRQQEDTSGATDLMRQIRLMRSWEF